MGGLGMRGHEEGDPMDHSGHCGRLEAPEPAERARALWCGCDLARATTAVVLAAGERTRLCLSTGNGQLAKPLTPVAGTPLVVRALRTLWNQGIQRAIVVTGCAADEVEAGIRQSRAVAGLDIRFVRNTAWQRGNGSSVLAARALAGDAPFLLTMADRLYCGSIVAALRGASVGGVTALLAVERRLEAVRDVDDAVRVRTDPSGRIRAIGKGLMEFDGVDTGVMLCRSALFDVLEQERSLRGGDCSLRDAIRRLAGQGRAFAVDTPAHAWWHDVDTAADLRLAEVSVTLGLAMVFR
jgi:choline kinase